MARDATNVLDGRSYVRVYKMDANIDCRGGKCAVAAAARAKTNAPAAVSPQSKSSRTPSVVCDDADFRGRNSHDIVNIKENDPLLFGFLVVNRYAQAMMPCGLPAPPCASTLHATKGRSCGRDCCNALEQQPGSEPIAALRTPGGNVSTQTRRPRGTLAPIAPPRASSLLPGRTRLRRGETMQPSFDTDRAWMRAGRSAESATRLSDAHSARDITPTRRDSIDSFDALYDDLFRSSPTPPDSAGPLTPRAPTVRPDSPTLGAGLADTLGWLEPVSTPVRTPDSRSPHSSASSLSSYTSARSSTPPLATSRGPTANFTLTSTSDSPRSTRSGPVPANIYARQRASIVSTATTSSRASARSSASSRTAPPTPPPNEPLPRLPSPMNAGPCRLATASPRLRSANPPPVLPRSSHRAHVNAKPSRKYQQRLASLVEAIFGPDAE